MSAFHSSSSTASITGGENRSSAVASPGLIPEVRRIALVGNPNCGKSTIFNALTGMRQKVGNFPGVTVERKVGRCRGTHGEALEVLDLPGTYSLQVRSLDEAVSRDVLLGRRQDTPRPDVVVCVLDASNLERNLYFLAQVFELGVPVVVALNMVDVAEANGWVIDLPALQDALGVPVIRTVGSKGIGIIELRQALSVAVVSKPKVTAKMPPRLQDSLIVLTKELAKVEHISPESRYAEALLLLALEDEKAILEVVPNAQVARRIIDEAESLRQAGVDPIADPVDARYAWIQSICQRCLRGGPDQWRTDIPGAAEGVYRRLTWSDRLDRVLTDRIWGWAGFLLAMGLMFLCLFTLGSSPVDWIQDGFKALADVVKSNMPAGNFQALLTEGAIPGVGSVVGFLPQILILFFFIGLLEDTGYMARAAFIIDRVMTKVGLHGKSFIPLLSSFACAIPGIMATRTIESRKDRLATILVAPLMACSARLPVYSILIAAMMPSDILSVWAKASIMLGIYLFGMVYAFGLAWLFKKTFLRGEVPLLILELPPYRFPSMRAICTSMFHRGAMFLRQAGTVILAISIVLWALASFPNNPNPNATSSEKISYSAAGRLGHFIEPAIRPLGYDWRVGVGIVSSFAQREVFVSTMAIIYNVEEEGGQNDESATLRESFRGARWPDGRPVFTPLVCVSLMVFYALAMQCVSTLVVVYRETKSLRWPIFQLLYMTGLAYVSALAVYQIGSWMGLG